MLVQRFALLGCLLLTTTMTTSCGAGGAGGASTGTVTLAMTDSASDELDSFEVDVSNITMTKLDDTVVSLTTKTARVDFVDLDTVSEMIARAALPVGIYKSMALTMDFTNASVSIKGKTTPATVLDMDGNPITGLVPVQVDFASSFRPDVVYLRRDVYQLDLDLNSAVTVDATNNAVTFSPAIVANVLPTNPKPLVTTGTLAQVDASGNTVTISRRSATNAVMATFQVNVDSSTVYQIDGMVYSGAAGLNTLAMQTFGTTRVYLQGTLDTNARTITANAIEAGAGTRGNGQDWVIGHVISRNNGAGTDAALTVLGRSVNGTTGTITFNSQFTVNTLLGLTRVLRRGAGNSLTTDALDVGQRIIAFGKLTGSTLDTSGNSGGPGVVRMLPTSVFGYAAGAPVSNVLTLNVTRFDLRDISNFDFTVGGNPEATPTSYTVDVTGLDTSTITTNSKMRCIGWANPVGVPMDDNFTAATLENRDSGASVLLCQWVPPSATAIPTIGTNVIGLDVSGATISAVGDGFSPVTVTNSPAPTIVPAVGIGFYLIVQNGSLELNLDFNQFGTSLLNRLSAGGNVFRVSSSGSYDGTTQTFSAFSATVILN
jgi:Domain of unknown function (DUF4382)